jgi:flagellar biosynthesis/type III secretory pathway chaperone
MSERSAAVTRERLEKILGESIHCALGLKDILCQERNALREQDTALLGHSASLKETCIDRLASLESARGAVSRDAGFSTDLGDMPALTEWCDADSIIANCWQHFTQIARECDALNSTNGAIIRVRRQQILAGLALLSGSDGTEDTYKVSGAGTTGFGGRELAEA